MNNEHLVPIAVRQMAETVLTTKSESERSNILQRLDVTAQFCEATIERSERENKLNKKRT